MAPGIQDVIDSSAVLVFMNPAHQTALNARKRLIERRLIDVGQELQFTAALLSCRHCCRQGGLWYHRQWLLQRVYPIPSSHQGWRADLVPDSQNFCLAPNELSVEVNIVARACELYPCNYFGWMHRTICIQSALVFAVHSTASDVFTEVLSKEVISVTQWIESRISDYSAVHHLKTLAHLAEDMESTLLQDNLQCLLPIIDHVVTLVRAFPEHETLWMYLRVFWVEGDVTVAFITSFVLPLQSTGMMGDGNESREWPCGARHAHRFLEWRSQRLE
jgi:protein prenyltransferase alpha subunit repeat containing protein 1